MTREKNSGQPKLPRLSWINLRLRRRGFSWSDAGSPSRFWPQDLLYVFALVRDHARRKLLALEHQLEFVGVQDLAIQQRFRDARQGLFVLFNHPLGAVIALAHQATDFGVDLLGRLL